MKNDTQAASQPWSAANFKPNTLRSKAVPAPGTMSETRKAPAATLTHNTLQQPLRSYMLPHLSPQSLTALRQACQTTQILVDDHTAKMWTRHALRLGIPPQLLPRDSSNAHAVYTLLHQRATLISRIRHWEPTSTAGNFDTFPCYDSESDSGQWEMEFRAKTDDAITELAIMDTSSAQAGFIHEHDGFLSNCRSAYEEGGQTYILWGASKHMDGCLTNRINVYNPHQLGQLAPHDERYVDMSMGLEGSQSHGPWTNHMPSWQHETSWETASETASASGHGSLVAGQSGRSTFAVIDLITHATVAEIPCIEDESSAGDIVSLQWSSSGNHIAVQVGSLRNAQLIIYETGSWQRIACHEHPSACSLTWAPAKDALAILHGTTAQVLEPPAAGATLRQLSGRMTSTPEMRAAHAFKHYHTAPAHEKSVLIADLDHDEDMHIKIQLLQGGNIPLKCKSSPG
ncbi:hypothetical protein WJX74_003789 [Apatococcus lobatus]|uniref:F-box domain-containing protein n=1 Tax=Apatococcus lobatus TaxID=904363 RepID=A0AAW1RS42_9CHLO